MEISMPAYDWLAVLRKEYLQDFIKSGGAAVKFAVQIDGMEQKRLLGPLRQMQKRMAISSFPWMPPQQKHI